MDVKNKLYRVILLAILLLAFGVIGFLILGNYNFTDALYMTVITISTVGFSEVHPFGEAEKIFSIILIITSVSIFGYILSVITEFLSNDNFFQELKFKRMEQKIKKLKNHTIVCGYGRNGNQAVNRLINNAENCVVIEVDSELIKEIEELGVSYIKGDATDDKILEKAGIKNAANLISTLPRDADNLYVVLSARQYNKTATIISRASKDTSERKLRIAGASNVIMPDKLGGDHMASLVVSPDLIEFVDKLSLNGDCNTNLKEIEVNKLPKEFINKTVVDLDLRRKTGCSLIGFKSANNEYIVNPEPSILLEPNSKLILLGNENQIENLQALFD